MEKFYLELDEDFFSIIDRIKRSRDDRIILIVPGGLSALRSIINLRILKEESLSLGKEVAIVTSDSLIKKLAQQVNVMVAERIKEEPKREIWEEKREKEFEKKFVPGKKVISDIVIKKPRLQKPTEIRKIEPKVKENFYESIEQASNGEEFRDLGDKEEQFDELFVKKRREEIIPKRKERKEEREYEEKRDVEIHRFREEEPPPGFFTLKRIVLSLLVLVLIGGGIFVYFILPKAEISINPRKEPVQFETELAADKNINTVDLENGIVPAQVFQAETEDTRTFPTTGEKDVSDKAHGQITIYNQFSSSEQTLVKTTRFRSESGQIFRLTDTVIIPGASIEEGKIIPSSKIVYVEADEVGDAYNIGPSKFLIPGFEGSAKYTAFYGISNNAMSGGAKGKMKVATKEDIDGATQIVSLELKNKAKDEFTKSIPKELTLLDNSESLEVTEASASLKADQPGESFTVTVKAKAWGLAFKEEDILSAVKQNVESKIAADKFLVQASMKLSYSNVKTDTAQGKATFSCQIDAQAGWNIDENKLKNDLAGKSETEVRQYLSGLAEIDMAKVTFWPFWVKKIPSNKNKIKIIIEGK